MPTSTPPARPRNPPSAIATISTPTLAAGPTGGRGADVDDTAAAAAAAPAAAAAAAPATTTAAAAAAAPPTTSAAAKCLAYRGLAASAAAAIRDGWHAAATGTEEPARRQWRWAGGTSTARCSRRSSSPTRGRLPPSPIASLLSPGAVGPALRRPVRAGGRHTTTLASPHPNPNLNPNPNTNTNTNTHPNLTLTLTRTTARLGQAAAHAVRLGGGRDAATLHARECGCHREGTEEPGAPAPTLALGASAAAATSVADDAAGPGAAAMLNPNPYPALPQPYPALTPP